LVRGWTHLDRQKGGIGLRGAGETQIEMDQRVLTERVRAIEKRLAKVRTQRDQGRRQRRRTATRTIALVGYTNAGKSTLFNRLTTAEVFAADRLFATLDPTLRKLELDGAPEMVLADTVGFVRHLPHSLVEAFKATLEEVVQADLLLHVLDASAPDIDAQSQQVHAVLEEIGAADRPLLEVYNKIDRIEAQPGLERDAEGRPSRVWLSAVTGKGVELLGLAIAERLNVDASPMRVHLAPSAQKTRSWLYRLGAVMHEQSAEDGGSELTVRLDRERLAQLERQPGVLLPAPQGVHRISPSR
jgi:GTP-binding protein HflX